MSARLTIKDSGGNTIFSGATVTYNGTTENPGNIMQIPLQGTMPLSQATGEYA